MAATTDTPTTGTCCQRTNTTITTIPFAMKKERFQSVSTTISLPKSEMNERVKYSRMTFEIFWHNIHYEKCDISDNEKLIGSGNEKL